MTIRPSRALWKLVHQNVQPKHKSTNKVAIEPIKFIAFDGEGLGEGSDHRYVLFMTSEGDVLKNYDGLSTRDCLNFMCEVANRYKGQKVIFVCFASSYDVNMMLRDISYNNALRLQRTGTLRWQDTYVIEYLPHKNFCVSRYPEGEVPYRKAKNSENKSKPNILGSIRLWDVFSFFQGSFLNALKTCFSEAEREALQYEKIADGKARRSQFSREELENGYIEEYTTLEVAALVALMERMNGYCIDAGIKLRRWDGAGAVASALLEKHDILRYYPESIPEEVMIASTHAFGGGRAEQFRYGHVTDTPIFHADRNSAYPSAMVYLRNLASGNWVTITKDFNFDHTMSLYKLKWNFEANPQPFYPFFYRDRYYNISYPQHGYGWVWWPEMMAALKHNPASCFEIQEQISFIPDTFESPYDFVFDLYKKRQELKAAGNGMQIVYKLGYNSLYGKTVQRLGYRSNDGNKPKYFQLQYGGWTTSHCRGAMYDAMMQHPSDVIAVATDGFWSTATHNLPIGKELNQWEAEELTGGTFVQSGVYWVYQKDGTIVHHSRGLDKDALNEKAIIDRWAMYKKFSIPDGKLLIPSTRFVTLGSAIASEERWKNKWHTWDHSPRDLQLYADKNSNKRQRINTHGPNETDTITSPHLGLVDTKAHMFHGYGWGYMLDVLSKPYPLPWDKEANKEKDEMQRDNEIERLIQEEIEAVSW